MVFYIFYSNSASSDLGVHCLPICPTKRMLGFNIWVKHTQQS